MELLLGPDGEYIREIIIDELAKGIDAGWRSSIDGFVGSTRSRLLRAFGVSNAALCCRIATVCVCPQNAVCFGMVSYMHITLCGLDRIVHRPVQTSSIFSWQMPMRELLLPVTHLPSLLMSC